MWASCLHMFCGFIDILCKGNLDIMLGGNLCIFAFVVCARAQDLGLSNLMMGKL